MLSTLQSQVIKYWAVPALLSLVDVLGVVLLSIVCAGDVPSNSPSFTKVF